MHDRSALAVAVLSYSPSPALKTQRRSLQRSNRSQMILLPKYLCPRLLLKMLVKLRPGEMKRNGSGKDVRGRGNERRKRRKRGSERKRKKRKRSGSGKNRSRRNLRRKESPKRRRKGNMKMEERRRLK